MMSRKSLVLLVALLPACAEVVFGDFETYDRQAGCTDGDCEVAPDSEDDGETCTDGLDNDEDGHVDCDDFDCIEAGLCGDLEGSPDRCADGIDNDGDGWIDCDDFECRDCSVPGWTAPTCMPCE